MRNKPALTAADVHKAMTACRDEAAKNKWSVTIAVVDDAGYLLHLERLDGAGPMTAEVAVGKARTAAVTRRPTKVWEDLVKAAGLPQVPGQPADPGRGADHAPGRMRGRDRRVGSPVPPGRADRQRRRGGTGLMAWRWP
jgi:hypothetical protein